MNTLRITLIAFISGIAWASSQPAISSETTTLEIVAELDNRPGNPAIGPNGEIYLSMHPFDAPEFKVARLEDGGRLVSFPTPELSRSFVNVIAISSTDEGVICMLDMGSAEQSPKLIGWSVPKNTLQAVHYLPLEAIGRNSFSKIWPSI